MCVCARARGVSLRISGRGMKERTVNLRSRSKQVDARRAHVRLSTPMHERNIQMY